MEAVRLSGNTGTFENSDYGTGVKADNLSLNRTDSGQSRLSLLKECGLNFFLYLKKLNLSNEPDFLVLPSNHHYYYDAKELERVRVLIILKKLNVIKHVDMFLNTLIRVLPRNASFIGCFSDRKTGEEQGSQFNLSSRLFDRFINFLDSKTDQRLNSDEVSALLERSGFKTVDMKTMNGLTYFCCKVSGSPLN